MSRSRLSALLWPVAMALIILASLPGCESKPLAPDFNNPFDPNSPGSSNPLNLTAAVNGNSILLIWDQPQGMGITTYDISHSFELSSGFEYVATVDQTTTATTQFDYDDPDPTHSHYFKVQAFDARGSFAIVADQVPAFVSTGPKLIINGDPEAKIVASRYLDLTVTVTSQDSILIANDPEFASAVAFQVGEPGAGQDIVWELPLAAQGDTLMLYAKGYTGSLASAVTAKELTVDFSPGFNITGKPATVPTHLVDLEIENSGVVQMRFANSEEALATAPWQPAAATLVGFVLGNSAGTHTIFGEFTGDFGFQATGTWDVDSDLMENATFALDLPGGDVTTATTVTGLCQANATLMRFSARPDFLGVEWLAYADTAQIDLDPQEGLQTIYAQFRNDWTDSDILTDTVTFIQQPASVGFLAPLNGQVIRGGNALLTQGFSFGASNKVAVDSVSIDLGDGAGFLPVTGTTAWSYLWDVPSFTADTELTLRVRAWAAGDSATATIGVTVTQLLLTIGDPLDGAELVSDTDVNIVGTAQAMLNGPALDQVSLEIAGQTIVATGTDIWSATWHTPVVTESTAYTLAITVLAGTDFLTREIEVTVSPATP